MSRQYTAVICLRLLPEDYSALKAKAEAYRKPVSAFARNAICGIPMVCHLDEDAVEMLLRVGGLFLKMGKDKEIWTSAERQEFLLASKRVLGIAQRIENMLPDDAGFS
uniref:Uncharacterized protein n=1 Tax=mine drainage metagenome TaxID=410659 RepID=E6QC88_9ZZZZ